MCPRCILSIGTDITTVPLYICKQSIELNKLNPDGASTCSKGHKLEREQFENGFSLTKQVVERKVFH